MNPRLKKLISVFDEKNIDGLLVTKDENIQYLTDFPANESWLLVSPKKTFYITDSRYVLEARQGLRGIAVKCYPKSMMETFFELVSSLDLKRIGFDERQMSLAQYKILSQKCPAGIELVGTNNVVEDFREVKEPQEIALIRKALSLHHRAHKLLKKWVTPGVSERDVFLKLEQFVKSQKAGFSFDPIIASGPNSCYPHARVTDRKLRRDEPVLVDMGMDINGYKSDLTRIFFLGRIPKLVTEINDKVRESQLRAIAKIKPGVMISDVDGAARNYLAENKLAKFFGHALGHGVGLEIHEAPRLSKENSARLKEGMVITVEPAVYIPHQFGIRIEDMVLVTKNGCEVLSVDIL